MNRKGVRLPPARALLDRVALGVVILTLASAFGLGLWLDQRAQNDGRASFDAIATETAEALEELLLETEQRLLDIRAHLGSSWPVSQTELERYVELSYDPDIQRIEPIFVATLLDQTEVDQLVAAQLQDNPDFEIRLGSDQNKQTLLIVTASALQHEDDGHAAHDLNTGAEVSGVWPGAKPWEDFTRSELDAAEILLLPVSALPPDTHTALFGQELSSNILGSDTIGVAVVRSLDNEVVGIAALILNISEAMSVQLGNLEAPVRVLITHSDGIAKPTRFSLGSAAVGVYNDAVYEQTIEATRGNTKWKAQIWSTDPLTEDQSTARLLLWLGAIASAAAAYTGIVLRRAGDMRVINAEVKYAESRRMLRLDGLTGLLNRAGIHEALTAALDTHTLREHHVFAVIFMDLNKFKPVNDSYGHDIGDEVLRRTATALRSALRASDSIARLGGDEFVVLCRDVGSPTTAARLARDIHSAMNGIEIDVDDEPLRVQVSVGVNITLVGDDPTLDEVLSRADTAMYAAKRSKGSHRTCITVGTQEPQGSDTTAHNPQGCDVADIGARHIPIGDLSDRVIGELIEPHVNEPGGDSLVSSVFCADREPHLYRDTAAWLNVELSKTVPDTSVWEQWIRLPSGGLNEDFLREFAKLWTPTPGRSLMFVVREDELDRRVSRHPGLLSLIDELEISLVVDEYGLGTTPISRFEAFSRVKSLLVAPDLLRHVSPRNSLFDAVSEFASEYEIRVAIDAPLDGSAVAESEKSITLISAMVPDHPGILLE